MTSTTVTFQYLMEEAMREREVEKKLIDEVKKRGGLCEK